MGRAPPSPSPQKPKPLFSHATYNPPRPLSRPTSPLKYQSSAPNLAAQHTRVPSSSSFNPTLPSKTPTFPPRTDQTAMRLPRRDENMLSINGSPLANPYEFGLGWFTGIEMAQMDSDDDPQDGHGTQKNGLGDRTLKRTKSGIIIRRDPSVAFPATMNGYHSRTDSQASFYTASSQATSSSSSHSRENSFASHSQPNFSGFRFPAPPTINNQATPRPALPHQRSFSALVAIPTKDGHLLEFDPLQTSPGALNALEGITDSAKKQARAEMGRLVQAAVDKWKILPS